MEARGEGPGRCRRRRARCEPPWRGPVAGDRGRRSRGQRRGRPDLRPRAAGRGFRADVRCRHAAPRPPVCRWRPAGVLDRHERGHDRVRRANERRPAGGDDQAGRRRDVGGRPRQGGVQRRCRRNGRRQRRRRQVDADPGPPVGPRAIARGRRRRREVRFVVGEAVRAGAGHQGQGGDRRRARTSPACPRRCRRPCTSTSSSPSRTARRWSSRTRSSNGCRARRTVRARSSSG